MTTRGLAGLGLALSFVPAAFGQERRAESAFPFEPVQARSVALGGAGAALLGPAFAFLNPAALASQRGAERSRRASPTGARDYAISAGHGGHWGTIRISARRRDWGQVAQDLGLNDLTAGEQAVALAFAQSIANGRLAWGLSVARLDAAYLGAQTGAWAADLGAQAHIGKGFGLGIALLHLGDGFPSQGGRAPLPTRLRPGVAWEGRIWRLNVLAAADAALHPRLDSPPDLHTGGEARGTWGAVTGAMRAGYRSLVDRDGSGSRPGVWAIGGGLGVGRIAADVSYTFGAVFGEERFVSLALRW